VGVVLYSKLLCRRMVLLARCLGYTYSIICFSATRWGSALQVPVMYTV
jgi:hypothetical protein